MEAYPRSLRNSQHVHFVINCEKVLIKKVDKLGTLEKTVSQAFPGLKLSDFYYELVTSGEYNYVAVCRKDFVDALLAEAKEAKLLVRSFQLGFGGLSNLLPLLNESSIETSRYQFAISEVSISSFSASETPVASYQIEDINVPGTHILGLSGLLSYVSNNDLDASNYAVANGTLRTEYAEQNFFRKGLPVGVGVLLLLLLINFVFYNSYFGEQQELQENVELLQSRNANSRARLAEVKTKEQRIENILNSGSSKSSYFINRIMTSAPGSVKFSEFNYQPLQKKIKEEKKVLYRSDEILLGGVSHDRSQFSKWIETLEEMDWVSQVIIVHYGEETRDNQMFHLKVMIDES